MNQQETAAPATPNKKQVRKEIVEKLTGALADYKQELGEKKLATHVKKVSKLISRDLEKSSKKQEEETRKKTPKVAKAAKTPKAPKAAKAPKASKKADKKAAKK